MNKIIPGDLPALWRERAETLRSFGDAACARLWDIAAVELERAQALFAAETLSLTEAARASGYTADYLGNLVKRGKIANAGRTNAPRIRRQDLPPHSRPVVGEGQRARSPFQATPPSEALLDHTISRRTNEDETEETWSVQRIKHPLHPEFTVRVGEFRRGEILHIFRKVNGKQTSCSVKCRRSDLGVGDKAQETEARRLACEYIEALANPDAVVESPEDTELNPPRTGARNELTITALADRCEVDGMLRVTAPYKRDTVITGS
ncbi:MAG: hypothetical protein ACJ8AK_13820 [Gemmatimonadaceae bacterium]